jgi:threonine/homoserine/homoserine lactone efflux protein
MTITFLIKGLLIGFSIAAPVGPIGLLCIRRTLANGRLSGFVSGLGAATADGFYGAVAAFGISFISNALVGQQFLLRLLGGLFLCYLGGNIFWSKPAKDAPPTGKRAPLSDYLSTFVLTLTNPLTILAFAGIFAGLGLIAPKGNYFSATLLVAGVFLGSALWWLILSEGVSLSKAKFHPASLQIVNRLAGLIILGFGLVALIGILRS